MYTVVPHVFHDLNKHCLLQSQTLLHLYFILSFISEVWESCKGFLQILGMTDELLQDWFTQDISSHADSLGSLCFRVVFPFICPIL